MSNRRRAIVPIFTVLLMVASNGRALADTISNNLDATIDATLESMTLTAGGTTGVAGLFVTPTNGDGKNGCNLTSATSLVVSVASSAISVATVSPPSITFTSCGATPSITVTPLAAGTATVTLTQTTNTSGATFDLAPAAFSVTVGAATPPNAAPNVGVITGPASLAEGSAATYGSTATDPDGDPMSYGWSVVSGPGAIQGAANGASVSVQVTDGPSTVVLHLAVSDDHGHTVSPPDRSVAVTNVPPRATFTAPGAVNEGDPFTLSLTAATDPSGPDAAAGFTYAFDCGAGLGAFGSAHQVSCATADDATLSVAGVIRDRDGGQTTQTATVRVRNVAPTATLSNDGPIDEGGSVTVSFSGASDPSGADLASLRYAFDCAGDDLSGTTYASAGHADHATCSFPDGPATPVVTGAVLDDDGGVTTLATTVVVGNVAPTAVVSNDGPIEEGGSVTVSLSGASDPSTDDLASLRYAFDCAGGDLSGTTYASAGHADHASCAIDDGPATPSFSAAVVDRDGGISTYTTTTSVANVAPTATFSSPGSVAEGDPIHLALTDPVDPSVADATAGFGYAFDCGSGLGAFGPDTTTSCPTTDDGTLTVGGSIADKDGGRTDATASVDVVNVAPTGDLSNDGPIDEGSSATISFSHAHDPSPADEASLRYVFDCGGGDLSGATYATASPVDHVSCGFDDGPESPVVTGAVLDDDGGIGAYSTTVDVRNVAPTGDLGNDGPVGEGSPVTVSFSGLRDPSPLDRASLRFAFDCDGGDLSTVSYADGGAQDHATCTFPDGPASPTVTGVVIDRDGGRTATSTTIEVRNVAPTADLSNDGPIDEGSSATISFSHAHDPSPADEASLRYVFDCTGGDLSGAVYATASPVDHVSCAFDDGPASPVVTGAVLDRDGGFSAYDAVVHVRNVAPSATIANDGPITEGGSATISLTGATDPSPGDAASLRYAFDCAGGDLSGASYASATPVDHASCAFDDGPATPGVSAAVIDRDGGIRTYATNVEVRNAPPTGTLSAPGPTPEAGAFTISIAAATDPSTADAASLRYAFDCAGGDLSGATYAAASPVAHASCAVDDGPATATVSGAVLDKDGGVARSTASVGITNVAPAATLGSPATVPEGSAIALALTAPHDPSSADTTAGFRYAFDCGGGLGAYGGAATASCPTADDATLTVAGSVRDKDGGATTSSRTVQVTNVAPSIVGFAIGGGSATACLAGNRVTVSFTVTDPADQAHDPITGSIDWGDGSSTPVAGRSVSVSHTYAAGSFTLGATVNDGDGGVATATGPVDELYAMSSIQPPVNADGSSVFKYGSTVPVKVRITDCAGTPVPGLAPRIGTEKVSGLSPTEAVNETASTSAADTTGVMRYDASAGQYIYNWASKEVADGNATYYFYVRGKNVAGVFVTSPQQVSSRFGLRTK